MFGKKKEMERQMEMLRGLNITSKASLKQYCLMVKQCDVDEAQKLYDFIMKDMEELPMFDPVPPTWVDNTKNAISSILDFVKEHQEGLTQGYDIIRGILSKRGKELPDITKAAETVAKTLPPIN